MEVSVNKSEVLHDTFFLKPVVDDACEADEEYLALKFKCKPITNSQIKWVIL